jgi:hypothetical protein
MLGYYLSLEVEILGGIAQGYIDMLCGYIPANTGCCNVYVMPISGL